MATVQPRFRFTLTWDPTFLRRLGEAFGWRIGIKRLSWQAGLDGRTRRACACQARSADAWSRSLCVRGSGQRWAHEVCHRPFRLRRSRLLCHKIGKYTHLSDMTPSQRHTRFHTGTESRCVGAKPRLPAGRHCRTASVSTGMCPPAVPIGGVRGLKTHFVSRLSRPSRTLCGRMRDRGRRRLSVPGRATHSLAE